MPFTKVEVDEAERRLLQNVLEVREGDQWVTYGSAKDLRIAIDRAKNELANKNRPMGYRRVSFSTGYDS